MVSIACLKCQSEAESSSQQIAPPGREPFLAVDAIHLLDHDCPHADQIYCFVDSIFEDAHMPLRSYRAPADGGSIISL